MTDQMLRDLLEERVSEVSMQDLSGVAWRQGRQARRRDRLTMLGAAAVAMAAVTIGVAVQTDGGRSTKPMPAPGVPTSTSLPADAPDTTFEGVPVRWSLGQDQEVNLPRIEDAPLPEVIDLEAGPSHPVVHLDRVRAAFARVDSISLVAEDGVYAEVDISFVDKVVKPNGYGYRPLHHSMLSPTGQYLVFPQNRGLRIYTVATGGWSEIDTGDARTLEVSWYADDVVVLPRNGTGSVGPMWTVDGRPAGEGATPRTQPGFDPLTAQAFGPTRAEGTSSAQAWGMGVPIPVADAGSYLSEPEFIAASVGGEPSVLAMMWDMRDDGHGGRFLQCCPVAGWLDDRTLVYESRQTNPALVAWTVGTNDFGLVSRIEGQYLLASFARLA